MLIAPAADRPPVHILERPAPEPHATLSYADRPTGVVDVFEPARAPRATIVLLHGGFWRAAYDRVHLRALAAGLAERGARVALPEYRRVGDAGGGFPGTVEDAQRILVAVPAMLGVSPDAVVFAGHSAGGHLAVLAAATADVPPARVVSLAGVLDMRAAHRARLSGDAVAELAGSSDPGRLAELDPMALPVPGCEVVLVHGARDAEVPSAYSVAYAARAARIRLTILDHADHYDLIDPLSPAFDAVWSALTPRG